MKGVLSNHQSPHPPPARLWALPLPLRLPLKGGAIWSCIRRTIVGLLFWIPASLVFKTGGMTVAFVCMGGSVIAAEEQQVIRVGSKPFTEGYVLAEVVALQLESAGFEVERRLGLGGTLLIWEALRGGEIDIYPEYTGTISEVILKLPPSPIAPHLSPSDDVSAAPSDIAQRETTSWAGRETENIDTAIRRGLGEEGVEVLLDFGFNNSYALVLDGGLARREGIDRISQLAERDDLRLGLSLEFLNREDGWRPLRDYYGLPQQPVGLEHALAYRAIESGSIHLTDAYTTDGELLSHDLVLLEDDRGFFPRYEALLLARRGLPEEAIAALESLRGRLDEAAMGALNAEALGPGVSPRRVAARFLGLTDDDGGAAAGSSVSQPQTLDSPRALNPPRARGGLPGLLSEETLGDMLHNTLVHLKLTAMALSLACLFALPVAALLSRHPRSAAAALYGAGLLQTVPSLALLAFMVPLLGLGQTTAIAALFLYSLLPIIRNTVTGINSIDPLLREVAEGMGLSPRERLLHIEIPLALPTMLAGIKTAAVISIGTATLAAFVGAGGLGEPIITGLTLNDHRLILSGAVPAALLAVLTEFLFETLERVLLPAHLRGQGRGRAQRQSRRQKESP